MRSSVVLALSLLAACSGKKQDGAATDPPQVGALVRGDGGVTAVVTELDPSGMHIDDPVAKGPAIETNE